MKNYPHFILFTVVLFINCGCASIRVHYEASRNWVVLDDNTLTSHEGSEQRGNTEFFLYYSSYYECKCLTAPFNKEFWGEKKQPLEVPWCFIAIVSAIDLPFSVIVDTIMLPVDIVGYKYPSVHDVNATVYDSNVRNISTHKIDYISQPYNNIFQIDVGKSIWTGSHTEFAKKVRIKWKKENGEIIEKQVSINGKIPKGFWNRDDVIFNINDNDDIILSFKIKNVKSVEINSNGNKVDYGDSSGI